MKKWKQCRPYLVLTSRHNYSYSFLLILIHPVVISGASVFGRLERLKGLGNVFDTCSWITHRLPWEFHDVSRDGNNRKPQKTSLRVAVTIWRKLSWLSRNRSHISRRMPEEFSRKDRGLPEWVYQWVFFIARLRYSTKPSKKIYIHMVVIQYVCMGEKSGTSLNLFLLHCKYHTLPTRVDTNMCFNVAILCKSRK